MSYTAVTRGCPGCQLPSPGESRLDLHFDPLSFFSECMNCTRLRDMSERLTTLEAKVGWVGRRGKIIVSRDRGTQDTRWMWLEKAPFQGAGLA